MIEGGGSIGLEIRICVDATDSYKFAFHDTVDKCNHFWAPNSVPIEVRVTAHISLLNSGGRWSHESFH